MNDLKNEVSYLAVKCSISGNLIHEERYKAVLENIKNNNFSYESKKIAYIELYKYSFLSTIPTSIDPRGDFSIKSAAISSLEKAKTQEEFEEAINTIKEVNESIKLYFENPLLLKYQANKHEKEFPGMIF